MGPIDKQIVKPRTHVDICEIHARSCSWLPVAVSSDKKLLSVRVHVNVNVRLRSCRSLKGEWLVKRNLGNPPGRLSRVETHIVQIVFLLIKPNNGSKADSTVCKRYAMDQGCIAGDDRKLHATAKPG